MCYNTPINRKSAGRTGGKSTKEVSLMHVQQLPGGSPYASDCWLLTTEGSHADSGHAGGGHAAVLDPSAAAPVILRAVREAFPDGNGQLDAILLTHGHFDHIGALDALLAKFPALPVVLRPEEWSWAFTHAENQYPPFYVHQHKPESLVADLGETFTCGGITARLIPTPGHTPGGQCILIEKDVPTPLCFTGDTLFQGTIGRTDLPGGSFAELNQSLKHLVATLAPETTLLPGHGEPTTLAQELRSNPFLQDEPDF